MISALAPVLRKACSGRVSATCSNPSATSTATRFPLSSRATSEIPSTSWMANSHSAPFRTTDISWPNDRSDRTLWWDSVQRNLIRLPSAAVAITLSQSSVHPSFTWLPSAAIAIIETDGWSASKFSADAGNSPSGRRDTKTHSACSCLTTLKRSAPSLTSATTVKNGDLLMARLSISRSKRVSKARTIRLGW